MGREACDDDVAGERRRDAGVQEAGGRKGREERGKLFGVGWFGLARVGVGEGRGRGGMGFNVSWFVPEGEGSGRGGGAGGERRGGVE